jgi:hypothetical protein
MDILSNFFLKFGWINEETWVGVLNLIIIPLFLLGLNKKIWTSSWYRFFVLLVFFSSILCSVVGYYTVVEFEHHLLIDQVPH